MVTAIRDSSTQRAIIARSVVSRRGSMAARCIVDAINRALAAVARFRGIRKLANWQYHSTSQFTAKLFACTLPELRESRAGCTPGRRTLDEDTVGAARVTIGLAGLFRPCRTIPGREVNAGPALRSRPARAAARKGAALGTATRVGNPPIVPPFAGGGCEYGDGLAKDCARPQRRDA